MAALNQSLRKTEFILLNIAKGLNVFAGYLARIKIPDWLKPGSPTPFELGLRGINSALKQVSSQGLPTFTAGLQFSPVGAGLPPQGASMGGGAGGGQANFYFQFGDAVTKEQALQMVDNSADSLIRAFTAAVRERRR